jgi:20S proteasome alpha/beta subunit
MLYPMNQVIQFALLALQYDLSSTTFSPDGRVFQTEYASKAVDNSGWVLQPCIICACARFGTAASAEMKQLILLRKKI